MSATQNPSVTPSGPVLEVTDLNVDFGVDNVWVPAARHVTYSVEPGEVLAIVGESGSGKSVSSMAIFGLLPSNARVRGSVSLRGRELIGLKPRDLQRIRGRQISMIFQEPMTALNPSSRSARRSSRRSASTSASPPPPRRSVRSSCLAWSSFPIRRRPSPRIRTSCPGGSVSGR